MKPKETIIQWRTQKELSLILKKMFTTISINEDGSRGCAYTGRGVHLIVALTANPTARHIVVEESTYYDFIKENYCKDGRLITDTSQFDEGFYEKIKPFHIRFRYK